MGKTIDAIGLVVNLEQVHRSAFCPLRVCVKERERKGVIDWISECLCHWEAKERRRRVCRHVWGLKCVSESVCGVTRFSRFNSIERERCHCNQWERWSYSNFCNIRADENDGVFRCYAPRRVVFGGIRAEESDFAGKLIGNVGNGELIGQYEGSVHASILDDE